MDRDVEPHTSYVYLKLTEKTHRITAHGKIPITQRNPGCATLEIVQVAFNCVHEILLEQ